MNGAIDANRPVKGPKAYKLMVDPNIVKGGVKLYRYDGVIPNDPSPPLIVPRDPRNILVAKLRTRLEPLEIPVPRSECVFLHSFNLMRLCLLDSKLINTMLANHLLLK